MSPILNKIFESQDRKRWLEFVEAVVQQEDDRVKQIPDYDRLNRGLLRK